MSQCVNVTQCNFRVSKTNNKSYTVASKNRWKNFSDSSQAIINVTIIVINDEI